MKKTKKMFVFGAILIAALSMCTQSISARTITLGVSVSCSTSLGVSESETSGITTSVSYTVPAKKSTCVYQIVAVFPAAKTTFEVYKMRNKEKFKVIKKNSITKMPYKDKSYYALEKG